MLTTLIGTADLASRLGAVDLVLVDARFDLVKPDWGEKAYRQAHLPGALYAHLDRDLAGPKSGTNGRHPLPSPEACSTLFGRLGIDAAKEVVVYDQNSGMFASRLWWMLRSLGHTAVAVLDGGFDKWVREARPTSDGITTAQAVKFPVRTPAGAVNARAIEASLGDRSLLIVDARSHERYRGLVEPLDPVAGRIPGAVNRPAGENLTADGIFKSAATLRSEFDALLHGASPTSVVSQCGSGVTACHNLLAMEIAGLSGARLYPGSWSEWCADPARPIAQG